MGGPGGGRRNDRRKEHNACPTSKCIAILIIIRQLIMKIRLVI